MWDARALTDAVSTCGVPVVLRRALIGLLVVGCTGSAPIAATPDPPSASTTPRASGPVASATATVNPETSATPGEGEFVNPVIDRDFPDAHVLAEDATYYAYATTDGRSNIQVARSRNLVDWELLDDGLPELPSWSGLSRLFGSTPQRATWAPEVVRVGDWFLMYYTAPALAREVASGIPAQCIGLAVSDTPEGPFRDTSGEPLVCYEEDGFSIDPSYFLDRDGAHYLLWRAGGRTGTSLQIQELSDDGSRLVGEPASTGVRNDQQWERFIVEAPTLVEKDGAYYLFYSGNDPFAAAYGVGYATADRVLGPYVKAEENPILASRAPAMGPGHQSVVVDGDGGLWLTYHAWDVAAIGYPAGRRALWIDELVIDDGKAEVRGPDAGPQAMP